MSEKPIRVLVAEALGWSDTKERQVWNGCWRDTRDGGREQDVNPEWHGTPPEPHPLPLYGTLIPRFDTRWEDTGPLIEKYRLNLDSSSPDYWEAYEDGDAFAGGATPLMAVCNLLLKLHRSGKLAVSR